MSSPANPSFDVVAPDGGWITIRPGSPDDRVRDLVRALRGAGRQTLTVDGEPVADHRPLRSIDRLRHGSVLGLADEVAPAPTSDGRIADQPGSAAADGDSARSPASGCVHVVVSSGPACGATVALAAGRHSIGRAACSTVAVADPAIEPHHGVLDVAADGRMVFTQLTGRVPARIDGCPADRPVELAPGSVLHIGSSVLRIGRPGQVDEGRARGSITAAQGDPWRRIVRRGPALADRPTEEPLTPPPDAVEQPRPPATGLIGAGVGVAGAVAIGSLLGQSMFVLFALIGAFASLATWFAGVVGARRRTRRARDEARRNRERFLADVEARRQGREEGHRARFPTIAETLDSIRVQRDAATTVGATVTARWNRRVDDDHPLAAVIGDGDLVGLPLIDDAGRDRLDPSTRATVERAERHEDAPAPIVLASDTATAIRGGGDAPLAVARSIIVQLAAWSGPADWHLVIVTRRPEAWRWAQWLPHLEGTSGERAIYGIDDGARVGAAADRDVDRRAILVVVDDLSALTSRTGPLRRFLGRTSAAALVLVDNDETVPSICGRTLSIGSTANAWWEGEEGFPAATSLRIAGIDEPTAAAAARRLAPLVDPELGLGGAAELPTDLRLADLVHDERAFGARAIADRWTAGGADPPLAAMIGASDEGGVDLDLGRDGPHGLIAGTTGAGKSELLRTLVVALAANVGPDHLSFVLVDYKGGSTFDACTDLPHTVGIVTDLDDGLAERALISLDAELRRREEILREVAASDLTDYRSRAGVAPLPRLVVVVDEFAALVKELPDFVSSLVGLAQRGRSLGVHLLLATQRPSGVVSDEIRANTNLRIALRLNDRADAHDVIGDETPSHFPRSAPGRVAMRLGPDELVVFQAARCSAPHQPDGGRLRVERVIAVPHDDPNEDGEGGARGRAVDGSDDVGRPSELRVIVAAIRDAARRVGVAAPHRPWCPPLPDRIATDELATLLCPPPHWSTGTTVAAPAGGESSNDAVGAIDDPANQRRWPLRWRVESGNLALVGSLGSGTTSTLLAVAAAQCRVTPSDRLHLYAIDANGDCSVDRLSALAHCGAVVRPRERERLARLLRRLVDEIDGRASLGARPNVRIVILVDGLSALRTALSSIDDAPRLAELDRVLAEGPSVGVVTAFTVDGVAPCASTAPAAERWLFHVDDPAVARGFGASGASVPADLPGRMLVASSGLAAQVAHGDGLLRGLPHRSPTMDSPAFGAPAVVTLPEMVVAADLREPPADRTLSAADDRSPRLLSIGLDAEDLVAATLRLPPDEHVFVGGLGGTGKSTALDRIVAAWRDQVPDGRVVFGSPTRALTRADLVAREPAAAHARSATAPATQSPAVEPSPTLLAIDDGERVDDADGVLRDVLDGRHSNVTIAVAASLDAVRAGYGHWTRDVARSRCGLIMTAAGEIDGDLLGVTLPRRSLIAPRPGLAWLVDGSGHRLVQVAIDR